jgi:O-antigen/teichoic acid export membrane protein
MFYKKSRFIWMPGSRARVPAKAGAPLSEQAEKSELTPSGSLAAPNSQSALRRLIVNSLSVAGGAGAAQAIALVAAPLISRVYEPAAFGRFAVAVAVIGLFLPVASLRYEWAFVLPKKDEQAIELLTLSVFLVTGFSLALAVALSLIEQLTSNALDLSVIEVVGLSLAVAVMGLHGVLTAWLVRKRAFAQLGFIRFLTVLGTITGQVGLGLVHGGTSGLLLGMIVGHALGLAAIVRQCELPLTQMRRVAPSRLPHVAAEYREFAIFSAPGGVINVLGYEISNLAIPALYGPATAGQTALAQRIVGQPAMLVGAAVHQVFWPDAARLFQENPNNLWQLFLRTNTILLMVMLPGALLTVFGDHFFVLIFGAPWQQAGTFAGILILAQIVSLPAHATSCLGAYRLNHLMSGWEIGRLALMGLAFGISWHLSLGPTACVIAVTAALATASIILFGLNAAAILRARAAATPHVKSGGLDIPKLSIDIQCGSAVRE